MWDSRATCDRRGTFGHPNRGRIRGKARIVSCVSTHSEIRRRLGGIDNDDDVAAARRVKWPCESVGRITALNAIFTARGGDPSRFTKATPRSKMTLNSVGNFSYAKGSRRRGRNRARARRHRKERNVERRRGAARLDRITSRGGREEEEGRRVKTMGQGKGGSRLYYRARVHDGQSNGHLPAPLLYRSTSLYYCGETAAQIKRVSLKRNSRIFNTHAARKSRSCN